VFTNKDGIRMKLLFSLRNQRGLNDTEQKELEELVDRWEQAYSQYIESKYPIIDNA